MLHEHFQSKSVTAVWRPMKRNDDIVCAIEALEKTSWWPVTSPVSHRGGRICILHFAKFSSCVVPARELYLEQDKLGTCGTELTDLVGLFLGCASPPALAQTSGVGAHGLPSFSATLSWECSRDVRARDGVTGFRTPLGEAL